jgi:hypothetical protein
VTAGLAAKRSWLRSRLTGVDVIDGKGVQFEELAAGWALGVGETPWDLHHDNIRNILYHLAPEIPCRIAVDTHGDIIITLARLEYTGVIVGRHVPIAAHL